jgi:hypothetical protein
LDTHARELHGAEEGRRAAEARAERADALVENLEANLRAKDDAIAEQRLAADQARTEAQQVQEAARKAGEQTEALRLAEEARKGRGRWARLRAAWRGV